jgi:hypothetical protein
MDMFNWLAFASALVGALLGTLTQLAIFGVSRAQKQSDLRNERFDAVVLDLDKYISGLAGISKFASATGCGGGPPKKATELGRARGFFSR